MYKKTVEYTDFNGHECKDDLYFHMSKNELADLEFSKEGGFGSYLDTVIKEKDPAKIANIAREIILMSYGKKSEDGKRFQKSPEIVAELKESPAYDELIFGFIDDPAGFAAFCEGILPNDMVAEIKKQSNNK